jgi:hypothetical protein
MLLLLLLQSPALLFRLRQATKRARAVVSSRAGFGNWRGVTCVPLTDKSALLPTLKHNINKNFLCSSVWCMELIWSITGTLGVVLEVLSEGAGLVLIGDCMNAVHADQQGLALASTLRCLLERSLYMQQTGGYAAIPL